MNKTKETLEKLAQWEKRAAELQQEKAELSGEILEIEMEINMMMVNYDKLCRELFKKK